MSGPPPARIDPWRHLAAFALGCLKWPPAALWAATPAEVRLAVQGLKGTLPQVETLTAAELAALQQRFPDRK